MKLKKGDTVVVLTGKDKGKQGEVQRVLPTADKVIVNGVNTATKHAKARRANDKAGIIDRDMPIHVSNVALVHKGKPVARRLRGARRQEGPRRPCRRRQDGGDLTMSDTATVTADAATAPVKVPPRLKTKYATEIKANLQQQLGLPNVMQVPALTKIVINMGVGKATQQPSLLEGAVADLTLIAGQKPIVTKAKTSIAGFKLREGAVDRHQGHAPRRPDVGVLRPADRRCHPPHP